MIAEIYPMQRMPRKFGAFDYRCPEDKTLRRGMIVQVPFRQQTIYGVVKRIKEQAPRGIKLKSVTSVISDVRLSDKEVAFFESLAVDLAQSVPSILHAALPTPPKRGTATANTAPQPKPLRIPKRETDTVAHIVHQMRERRHAFVSTPDVRRMTALVAGFAGKQADDVITVIVPNVRDAKQVADHLSHLNPLLLTGVESNNTRYATWRAFRNGSHRVLVGTRLAGLLPHPDMTTIFVLRSGHVNHRQSDRNPRYDTRMTAWQYHERFHTKLFYLDVAPRVDDIALFKPANRLLFKNNAPVKLVSMPQERPTAPHSAIGSTTVAAIEEALAQNTPVLCIYNKKGESRRLRCEDCPHRFRCPDCDGPLVVYKQSMRCHRCQHKQPLALQCPGCGGQNLVRRGFGNRAMRDALQSLFPETKIVISEKGRDERIENANIVLATRHYFENVFSAFTQPPFGLVVQLDADLPLYETSFRAFERAIRDLEEWHGVAHACGQVPFYAQTYERDLFASYYDQPENRLEEELQMRIAYYQPPARRWMRVHYRHKERRKSEHAIHQVISDVRKDLPEAVIYGPSKARPEGLEIEIGVINDQIDPLLNMLAELDDKYIIDTYAFM